MGLNGLCRRGGFTLIELLIVVAIIAILAAIAVPNFLEAQVRSKVSRAKADMRTMVTGLESYAVDNNKYPDVDRSLLPAGAPIKLGTGYSRLAQSRLTTPISYLSNSQLRDPFAIGDPGATPVAGGSATQVTYYGYANAEAALISPDLAAVGISATPEQKSQFDEHRFVLQSVGPDTENFAYVPGNFPVAFATLISDTPAVGDFYYDATNGTISGGDIVRTAKVAN
ncbi:MAG: prepilin-type N-terminal cleavage/methylation domain-containing protein [Sumerlaeia bacterium]